MDVDLLVASNVTDTLQQFRPQLEAAIRDVTFASKVSFSKLVNEECTYSPLVSFLFL